MEGCRALMEDNPQGYEWAVDDFARRGMAESAAALGDDAATNDEFVDEDGYDLRLGAVDGEMSRYGVERVGKEITAQAGEDDGCDVCRFGVVGTASLRSWYRCSAYPVLQGVFFHS